MEPGYPRTPCLQVRTNAPARDSDSDERQRCATLLAAAPPFPANPVSRPSELATQRPKRCDLSPQSGAPATARTRRLATYSKNISAYAHIPLGGLPGLRAASGLSLLRRSQFARLDLLPQCRRSAGRGLALLPGTAAACTLGFGLSRALCHQGLLPVAPTLARWRVSGRATACRERISATQHSP